MATISSKCENSNAEIDNDEIKSEKDQIENDINSQHDTKHSKRKITNKQDNDHANKQPRDEDSNDHNFEMNSVDDENYEEQLKADKLLVYSHPLFPLLALLFEKCERATHSIHAFETDSSLKSFDTEIMAFIEHHHKAGISLFTDNPDVDSLMIRSIQVFRIHLLELEKVSDLCTDFCARYMSCLKAKMRSDVLLRGTSMEDGICGTSSADNMDLDGDCCLLNETHNDSRSSSNSSSFDDENILFNDNSKIKRNDMHNDNSSSSNNNNNNNNNNNKNNNNNNNKNNNNNDISSEQAQFSTPYSSPSPSSSSSSCSLKSVGSPASSASSSSSSSTSGSSECSARSPQLDTNSMVSEQHVADNCAQILGNKNFSIEHLLSFNDLKVRAERALPLNFAELLQAQILSNASFVNANPTILSFPGLGPGLPNVSGAQASNAVDLTVKRTKIQTQANTKPSERIKIKSVVRPDCERSKNCRKSTDSKRDKTSKRGILPKHATAIMRTWLFQHIVHPYPTEDEKRAIAAETKLTMLQVNNWFINARRRILQPMLDSANTLQNELCKSSHPITEQQTQQQQQQPSTNNKSQNSSSRSDSKKIKSQSNSQQANTKFWSQSLANILQTSTDLDA